MMSSADVLAFDAAKGTLLASATKNSDGGRRKFFTFERQIFDEALDTLERLGRLSTPLLSEILQSSLATTNYDVFYALFDRMCKTRPSSFLSSQTSLLREAIRGDPGRDPESSYVESPRTLDIIRLLLSHGAPLTATDSDGHYPLYHACKLGRGSAFRLLLDAGARPQEQGGEALLSAALDLYWRDRKILDHEALIGYGAGEIISFLLDSSITANPQHPGLLLFFHQACVRGDLKNVQRLHSMGLDITSPASNLSNKRKNTFVSGSALHGAVAGGSVSCARFLLEHGISSRITAKRGFWLFCKKAETPIGSLVRSNLEISLEVLETCEALIDAGADVEDCESLLRRCVMQDGHEQVERLLRRGIRLLTVPETTDIGMIQLLCDHGTYLDAYTFLRLALSHTDRRVPSVELLQYLQLHHRVKLDNYYFHDMLNLLMPSDCLEAAHKHMLKYLLQIFGWTFDTPFLEQAPYLGDGRIGSSALGSSACCTSLRHINMLGVACQRGFTNAVRWLLDEGADVTSPGLSDTAIASFVDQATNTELPCSLLHEDVAVITCLLLRFSDQETIHAVRSRYQNHVTALQKAIRDASGDFAKEHLDVLATASRSTSILSERYEDFAPIFKASPKIQPRPLYRYQDAVGLTSFRLLVLLPAVSASDPLKCRLETHRLGEHPKFEALSYTWGETIMDFNIEIDGLDFKITHNLAQALSRMRSRDCPRYLWVDAICINQSDENDRSRSEKARQISIMRDIYGAAQQTLVWIGEATPSSRRLFALLSAHDEIHDGTSNNDILSSRDISQSEDQINSDVDMFCQRPWFFRTWILQEVAQRKPVMVVCGNDQAYLQDIENLIKRHESRRDQRNSSHPFRARNGRAQLKEIYYLNEGFDNLRGDVLIAPVLQLSRFCEASEPRDKVFGILGLFKYPLVEVDYDSSIQDVYQRFTEALINRRVWGHRLYVLHWHGTGRRMAGLSSWVPDWTISGLVGVLPRLLHQLDGRAIVNFPRDDSDPPRFQDRMLWIKGKRLDAIKDVGEHLPLEPDCAPGTPRFQAIISQWERLAIPFVGKDAWRGLEAFARTLAGWDRYSLRHSLRQSHFMLEDYILWDRCYGSGFMRAALGAVMDHVELSMAVLPRSDDRKALKACLLDYAENLERACFGRRLCTMANGSFGLAPPGARADDSVVFFLGGLYASVVRPSECDSYELVGDIFLEDLNVEELFAVDSDIPIEEFGLK